MQHLPSISPMVKSLPSAMTRLEKPPPKPLELQTSGGPSAFQESSKPFSAETPSRLGPRQLGQLLESLFVSPSEAEAKWTAPIAQDSKTSAHASREVVMV